MKTLLAVSVVFILSFSAYTQPRSYSDQSGSQPKSYIGLSIGPSLPFGKYADRDFKDFILNDNAFINTYTPPANNPGYAKTGFHVSGEGVIYFSSNFGLAGALSYSENPFDASPFNNIIKAQMSVDSSFSGTFSAGSYSHFAVMLGPAYGLEASEKVTVDFKVMVGVLTSSFSNPDLRFYQNNPYLTVNPISQQLLFSAPSSSSFAFSLGATLRYHLSPHFGMYVKAEVLWSSQLYQTTFTATEIFNDPQNNYQVNLPMNYGQEINFFNLGIGGAYEF